MLKLLQLVTLVGAAMTTTFPFWEDAATAGRPTMHLLLAVPLTRHGCGPSRYLTMRMAGDAVTQKPRDASLCEAFGQLKNDFQVSYDLYDTNSNAHGVTRAVLDIVSGKSLAKAVLGPNGSGSSKAASNVLGTFGIPLISWASTNADLSNKATYPTFFRVVPPDLELMAALAQFVQNPSSKWKNEKCTVAYFDADFQSSQNRDFSKSAAAIGLEIAATYKLPNSGSGGAAINAENMKEVSKALDNIKFSGTWVIVVFALNEEQLDFMKLAHSKDMVKRGYAWFGEPAGGAMVGDPSNGKYFNGMFGLLAEALGPNFQTFKDKWATDVRNLDLPEFNTMEICGPKGDQKCMDMLPGDGSDSSKTFKGWVAGKHDQSLQCTGYTAFAHDAMATFAVAFDNMLSEGKVPETITSADWMQALLGLKDPRKAFNCLSAGKVGFDAKQDRRSAFQIFWHKLNSAEQIPVGKVDSGEVFFCKDAGLACDTAQVHWPYNADTENPADFPGGVLASIPTGYPKPCEAGFGRTPTNVDCVPCSEGFYCPAGQAAQVECSKGHYCPAGQALPSMCPPGTYSNDVGGKTKDDCPDCAVGWFNDKEGKTACIQCAAGDFTDVVGKSECDACERGFYSEESGSATCQKCAATFTTTFQRSTSKGDCTCNPGEYWNRADDVCAVCPKEAFCNGGLAIPVVYAGNYARHIGDGTAAEVERQRQAKLAGTYTPIADAFKGLEIWSCQGEKQCPGEPSMKFDRDYGQEAQSVKDLGLEIGLRSPDVCPSDREGIACHICRVPTYGFECSDCSSNVYGLVIMAILMPIAFVIAYQFVASPYSMKATAAFQMTSTFGIMMVFTQFLSLLGSMNVGWPLFLNIFFDIGDFFLFDMSAVGIGCVVGNHFIGLYWMQILCPALVLVYMGIAYMLSQAIPIWCGLRITMNYNAVLNCLGMIYSALYISLCKIVMANLECMPQPNKEQGDQLLKWRQVECGSEEHAMATVPMVIGWLFYVVGFFILCAYLNHVAPSSFEFRWFRSSCKFLVNRWRADVWYWGSVYMLRNAVVAACAAIVSDPLQQILLMAALMALFLTITAGKMPWKDPTLAYFDSSASLMVVLACYCGIGILQLTTEEARYMRDGKGDALEDTRTGISTFAKLMSAQFIMALMIFSALVFYIVSISRPRVQKAIAEADVDHQADIVNAFKVMVKEDNFWGALARTIAVSTVYDVRNIEIFLQNVEHRLDVELGAATQRTTQTRLRGIVPGEEGGGVTKAVQLRNSMMLASEVDHEVVRVAESFKVVSARV